MKLRFEPEILELLAGSIDMHIHSAPDVYPRILNDMDLARQAAEMDMRAIVVKNHFFSTAERARLVSDETGFTVFGGLALNRSVGGLNTQALEIALKMGAKVIWMPTLHAREFLNNKSHVANLAGALKDDLKGLFLLDDDGALKEDVYPLIDLIRDYGAIMATGHISIREAKALVAAAAQRGLSRIMVTHPLASFVNYSVEDMKEMLDLGASYLEHVFNDTTRQVGHPITRQALFDGIKAVGAEHCIASTDSGQWLNPVPVQQMGIYMKDLKNYGFSSLEIRTMTADNPARILDL